MEKLVNLFQGAKASLKKRAFFKEPVEPVNLLANLFAGSNSTDLNRLIQNHKILRLQLLRLSLQDRGKNSRH